MATEMNFWTRLSSESPRFFVRVQNICIGLAGTATAVLVALKGLVALKTIPNFVVPSWYETAYGYIMVASVVAGAIAKTTLKEPTPPQFEKPAAPKDNSIQ